VSLSARTIPYASVEGSREQPFTEDLQLASLYILADARRGTEPLSAMVFLNYPFQLRRGNEGVLMIDMLGLNQTTFKFNVTPDVNGFIKAINAASEDPDAFLKALRGRGTHFKAFSSQRTVVVKGLVSHSRNLDEIQDMLKKSMEFNQEDKCKIFDPVLKERAITAIFTSLISLREDIAEDETSLKRARQGLTDALDITKKVLKEEIQNLKDNSKKIKTSLKSDIKKKRDRLKKRLNRDIAKLREAYKKQARPLREERTKYRRRLTRLEKRIERLRLEGDIKAIETRVPILDEVQTMFEKMDTAVRELEAQRDSEMQETRAQYKAMLKVEEDKIKVEDERVNTEVQKRLDVESLIEAEAKEITKQIDALIQKKRNRLNSLSKSYLALEAKDLELYIPFYVFQYGEKRFDFYPPMAVAGSGGLFSRFRRMLADNVESKLSMLIRPRGGFVEKYLAKASKSLGRKTKLAQKYRQEAENMNLFRSPGALNMIMKGLVKMRREGWISDSEYIRLQDTLIDKLSMISLS
jgi:Mg2+ and Co2+ transporter CorA